MTDISGPEHPDLLAAAEAIEAAKANYRAVLIKVRAACAHPRVVEQAHGSYGADLGHHHARRLCCDCGYEETSYWGVRTMGPWSGHNTDDGHTSAPEGARLVLKTEFVKHIPFGDDKGALRYRPLSEDRR